jgi:hypothetical protein
MKLENFELEIEGAREDAALISRNIGQQMASLLGPTEGIVDGDNPDAAPHRLAVASASVDSANKRTRRRRQASGSAPTESDSSSVVVDFKHHPEKFGNPRQDWKTADKSVWLLYVVKEAAGIGELTTRGLVETFNKHFRQSGTITTSNVTRDLGRLKVKEQPAPVGEDTSKTPSPWFLTEEGRKRAQNLVAAALGQSG